MGLLTYGKRQWEHLDGEMRELVPPLYLAVDELLPMIEADSDAFDLYVVSTLKIQYFLINAKSDCAFLNRTHAECPKIQTRFWLKTRC